MFVVSIRLRYFLLLVRINWSQTEIVRNFARSIYTRDPTCIRTRMRSCNFPPRQEIKISFEYIIISPFLSSECGYIFRKNRRNKSGKKACEKDRNEEVRTLLRTKSQEEKVEIRAKSTGSCQTFASGNSFRAPWNIRNKVINF